MRNITKIVLVLITFIFVNIAFAEEIDSDALAIVPYATASTQNVNAFLGGKLVIKRIFVDHSLESHCIVKYLKSEKRIWKQVFRNTNCNDLVINNNKITIVGSNKHKRVYGGELSSFWAVQLDKSGSILWIYNSRNKAQNSFWSARRSQASNFFILIGITKDLGASVGFNGKTVFDLIDINSGQSLEKIFFKGYLYSGSINKEVLYILLKDPITGEISQKIELLNLFKGIRGKIK